MSGAFGALFCGGCGEASRRFRIDFHGVFHAQDEGTGILQPPLLVGHGKVRAGSHLRACHLNGERNCEVVVLSVEAKYAGDLHLRSALRVDYALHLRGHKNNFGVFRAFQNFSMHLRIAAIVAAVAAGGIDYDGSASLACRGIEMHHAALQPEGSVDLVQRGAERVFNAGLRRIQRYDRFLRGHARRRKQRDKEKKGDCGAQPAQQSSDGSELRVGMNVLERLK